MNIKKIRTLLVKFDNQVLNHEVSAFRGAVIEKVGRENLLFNHHLDDKKYLYRYPLIQYKSTHKKPAIFCLGEGVDEIHKLFNQASWGINLKGKKIDLSIDQLNLSSFTLNMGDKTSLYYIRNWLSLNERNYEKYMELSNELDKIEMLEKILIGNILAFAKGVAWNIESEIKLRITNIRKQKTTKYKGIPLLAFDVDFSTNVILPSYIGLGKGASHGYGVLMIKN